MVTTFIGRNQKKTVDENLETMTTVWKPIVEFAEALGVKLAIENCQCYSLRMSGQADKT